MRPLPLWNGEIIQDLAARRHNCKFYDEYFRFLRQAHHNPLPWDRIHGELWLKSQVVLHTPLPSNANLSVKPKPDFIPKGYCFHFHKDRKCNSGYANKHLCFKCDGCHPVTKFNSRDSIKPSRIRSQPAKTFPSQSSHANKSWAFRFSPRWVPLCHCDLFIIWV